MYVLPLDCASTVSNPSTLAPKSPPPLSTAQLILSTPPKTAEKSLVEKQITKKSSELSTSFPKVLSEFEEFNASIRKEFSNEEILSWPQLFLSTFKNFLKEFSSYYLQGKYEEKKALIELFFYAHDVYQKHSSENQTIKHFSECQKVNKKACEILISLLDSEDAQKLVKSESFASYMSFLATIQAEILQVADKHFSYHRPYFSDCYAIGSHVKVKGRSSLCPMTLIELQNLFHANMANLLSYLYAKMLFKNGKENLPHDVQLLSGFLGCAFTTHAKPLADDVEISLHFPIKEFAASVTFRPQKLAVRFLGGNTEGRWERMSRLPKLFPFVELNRWQYSSPFMQEVEDRSHEISFIIQHNGDLLTFLPFLKTMLFEFPLDKKSTASQTLLKMESYFVDPEKRSPKFFYRFPELAPHLLSRVSPSKRLEILLLSNTKRYEPINKKYAHNYPLMPELQKLLSKLNKCPTDHTSVSVECIKGLLYAVQQGEDNFLNTNDFIPYRQKFVKALEIVEKNKMASETKKADDFSKDLLKAEQLLFSPQLFLQHFQEFLKFFFDHYFQSKQKKASFELLFFMFEKYQKVSAKKENQTVEFFSACHEINKKIYSTLLLHFKEAEILVLCKKNLKSYRDLLTRIQAEDIQVANKNYLIELQNLFHSNIIHLLSYLYAKKFFKNIYQDLPRDAELLIDFLGDPVSTGTKHVKPLKDGVEISLHFSINELDACIIFHPQKLFVRFLGLSDEKYMTMSQLSDLFPFVEFKTWMYTSLFQEKYESNAIDLTIPYEGNLLAFLPFLKDLLYKLPFEETSKAAKTLLKLKDYFASQKKNH